MASDALALQFAILLTQEKRRRAGATPAKLPALGAISNLFRHNLR